MVFIPIISQTYCDPKSFAWEHEFKEFIERASNDQSGLKVKLPGGNIANRILPIQIHDLDKDDKTLLENELGGVLRSIEFIYKSPGVNRPLRSNEEHPDENINHIIYRDQINKVANAIKEILYSMVMPQKAGSEKEIQIDAMAPEVKPVSFHKNSRIRTVIVIITIFLLSLIFGTKNLIGKHSLPNSIIVLPFSTQDLEITPFLASAYFKAGMVEKSDSIINQLISRSDLERNIDYQLAIIFSARGEKEKAVKWYKSAYLKHDLGMISTLFNTDLKLIINEPDVQKILKEIGIINDPD